MRALRASYFSSFLLAAAKPKQPVVYGALPKQLGQANDTTGSTRTSVEYGTIPKDLGSSSSVSGGGGGGRFEVEGENDEKKNNSTPASDFDVNKVIYAKLPKNG